MNRIVKHIIIPSIAPLALVGLYFTPKAVFGCVNRGLMALAVVLIATCAAVFTTVKGVKERRGGNKQADWWMISTLILLSSIVLLFGPLR